MKKASMILDRDYRIGTIDPRIYGSFIDGREPDLIIGKPYKTMAEYVAKDFGLRPDEIAMVGDRLYTDVKFATQNGMTGILVLTGETTLADLAKSDVKPDYVLDTFHDVLDRI